MKIRLPEIQKKKKIFEKIEIDIDNFEYDTIILTYCVVSIIVSLYVLFKKIKKD